MQGYSDESASSDSDVGDVHHGEAAGESDTDLLVALTPASLSNAVPCSTSSRLRQVEVFDGIMALGDSLLFVKPTERNQFRSTLKVVAKRPINYKGLSPLLKFPTIYEVSIGSIASMELSILFCTVIGRSFAYKRLVSAIQKSINEAIFSLDNSTRSKRIFISTHGLSRAVLPTEWNSFAAEFSIRLKQNYPEIFKNYKIGSGASTSADQIDANSLDWITGDGYEVTPFYYLVRKMGQDIAITSDTPFSYLANPYSEIEVSTVHTISVAVHIAVDVFTEDGFFLMWNLENVRKRLGTPQNQYNVYAIPGLGNLSYFYVAYDNRIGTKFIQFYSRCGHQLHRNNSTCFQEIFVTPRLAEAQGLLLNPTKSKAAFEQKIKVLNILLQRFKCVDVLIEQVLLPTAARCEIVYESLCLDLTSQGRLVPHGSPVGSIIFKSLSMCKYHMETYNLLDPENLVQLSSQSLSNWLSFLLVPCVNLLMRNTKLVLANVAASCPGNEKTRKPTIGTDNNEDESGNIPQNVLSSPDEYLDNLVAEALITFAIRGRLSQKWPVYIVRALGLFEIQNARRGERCKINYVQFYQSGLKCVGLAHINISARLPFWIGVNNTDVCGKLLTKFFALKHFNKRSNRDTLQAIFSSLTREFTLLLQSVVIEAMGAAADSRSPIQLTERSCEDKLNLPLMSEIRIKKFSSVEVKSPQEFIECLTIGKKVRPETIVTLLNAISTTTSSKFNTKNVKGFGVRLAEDIEEEILSQKCPMYFPLNQFNIVVVLPISDYSEKMIPVYRDALLWLHKKEKGLRCIHSDDVFRKTLPLYLTKATDQPTILMYLNLVNHFLDHATINGAESFIGKERLGSDLCKAFVDMG